MVHLAETENEMLMEMERYKKKIDKDTYESSAKSVIWILDMRARISISWRPSSVWRPLGTGNITVLTAASRSSDIQWSPADCESFIYYLFMLEKSPQSS